MDLKPLTADNTCPFCGGASFTLCRDFTAYSAVTFEDGEPVIHYNHEEWSDAEDGVRLVCVDCGEYAAVPDALAELAA